MAKPTDAKGDTKRGGLAPPVHRHALKHPRIKFPKPGSPEYQERKEQELLRMFRSKSEVSEGLDYYAFVKNTKTGVLEARELFTVSETKKSPYQQDFVTSIPDTKVDLRSVAAVLSDILGGEDQSILSICQRIVEQDAAKRQEKIHPPVPTIAPELWADRTDKSENPGQFIQRVYCQWLTDPAFHSGYVRRLDTSLERAFDRWKAKGAPDAPEGFHLPTKQEALAAEGMPSEDVIKAARYVGRLRTRAYLERKRDR